MEFFFNKFIFHLLFIKSFLFSSNFFYSKIVFELLIAKWSRDFPIWIYVLRFENNLAVCFNYIIILIYKISSIVYSSSLFVMKNSNSILINSFIQIYLISLNINIKITYKFVKFKLGQVLHFLRRQLLSFFVLLKSFELVNYIIEHAITNLFGCINQIRVFIYRIIFQLIVEIIIIL